MEHEHQLKVEFPRLYSLSGDKDGILKDYVQRRQSTGVWVFSFRRPLLAWEEEEIDRLQGWLGCGPRIRLNCPDALHWDADPSGQFTVASVRQCLEREGKNNRFSTKTWIN
ncbi:hypothetical protein ACSBR1_019058 [Camellia fascicularis]